MKSGARHTLWLLLAASTTVLAYDDAAYDAADDAPPLTPPPYVDRLIDGGNLSPDVSGGFPAENSGGWPRSLSIDAITSRVTRGDENYDESGLRMNAMLDTPNHGALTLDANLRTSSGDMHMSKTGNLFTLSQRALPMNGGWLVDNALGVNNAPSVDLARQQQRFWVPSILNNGLATEWRNLGSLQVHASAGRPGLLTGIYTPTFQDLGGEQASAGLQWNGANRWSAATQAVFFDDVRYGLTPLGTSDLVSGHSLFGSLAWGDEAARVNLNVIDSALDGRSDRLGTWIDGAIRNGRLRHTFGAFRFEDDMTWGNQPLTSDYQGGYYRAAFQSRQWVADGGIDYVQPVSGDRPDTIFVTGYARYQATSRLGVGGGGNYRQDDRDAWSTFAFADHTNRLGIGRLQGDYATDDLRERTQLTLNQTWNVPTGMRLGSSVSVGQESFAGRSTDLLGLAVNGGGDFRGNLSADINARWDTVSGGESSDNLLVNFAMNWNFAPGWSLGAMYYVSRASWRIPFDVTSPIDDFPVFGDGRTNDEGYFVTVRKQWSAGSRSAPIGGAPGSGAGLIEGFLFFDENENGLRDAGEAGVPNVVVLLNGRFSVRTNAEGRFEFPAVAAGEHAITVVSDNLPLPWMVQNDGRTAVSVGVRQRAFVAIGARRQR